MGSYISYLFVDAAELPNNPGGFVQLLFLMACYSFFLYQGSQLISGGSELLLLVPAVAGVVGSVVLPTLGAIPDAAIVLFSGLGDDAQQQLDVGVGALAGSTVMLLTLPWALCILAGRVDLDPATGVPLYRRPVGAGPGWTKLTPGLGWRHLLLGSGIPIGRPMRVNAAILAVTSLGYLIIQVPGFSLGCGKGAVCEHGDKEKYWALGGFLFAMLSFFGYLIYQLRVGGKEEHYEQKLSDIVAQHITEGHIGVADAFFAFMHEEQRNGEGAATLDRQSSAALLRHEHGHGSPASSSPDVAIGVNGGGYSHLDGNGAGHGNDASTASRTERKIRTMLKRFFRKYDRNTDGVIDLSEMQLLLRDIGVGLSHEASRGLFSSMDASGDARVDFDEFAAAMMLILQHPDLAQQLEAKAAAAQVGAELRAHPRRGQSVANLNALLRGGNHRTSTLRLHDGVLVSVPPTRDESVGTSTGTEEEAAAASASSPGASVGLTKLGGNGKGNGADSEDHPNEGEEEEVEEEEEEVPHDLAHLDPPAQQRAIKLRAGWMMGLGTALILLFSDPMCDCLSQLGARTHIPPFYVAFLLAPLAANASELLASVNYAAKKTPGSITISITSLEGSAIMNNALGLAIFLMLIFARDLQWVFSAETIAILFCEFVVALICMKRVHRGIDAVALIALYPICMGMVAVLEHGAGLN